MNTNDLPIDEFYNDLPRKNNDFYNACAISLKFIITALAILGIYSLFTYGAGDLAQSPPPSPTLIIPGPCELQEMLNQIEPENPIKVDGHIGPATIAKWNRVWFNQCAAKTFKVTKVKSD